MPRGPSEETVLIQVKVSPEVGRSLQEEAKDTHNKPLSHLCRQILEDYATVYDLPPAMVEFLVADRENQKMTKRQYIRMLLDNKYRELLEAKLQPPPTTRKK